MALIKEIELDNGVVTTYHNIIVSKDAYSRKAMYQICSYISKEARENNKNPVLITEQRQLPSEFYTGHIEKDVYEYLKSLDEYEDAIYDESSYFLIKEKEKIEEDSREFKEDE